MSERTNLPTPESEYFETGRFSGLSLIFGIGAVVGILLCVLGAIASPLQFSFSYLFGFFYFFTLCCGSLFWIIVHHAVDAEWSVVVRRQMENVAVLILVMALFGIPILIFRHQLFEWTNILPGHDANLDSKRRYLNVPFMAVRAVLYFVLLGGVAFLMRYFSTSQDRDGNPRFTLMMRKLAFFGLPAFALSLTFAGVDWLMGLNFRWFSTMWGPYLFAGAAGSSMALLVLIITALRRAGYLQNVVTLQHYHIMGKWMLAFSVFWAYIGFSQYMLYWYANIPEETQYYLVRNTNSWWPLSLLLVFGRFFLTFAILLFQGIKKQPTRLCFIAGWILFMQLLDIYIIVLPSLHGLGVVLSIWDLVCPIAIGCTLAFLFLRLIGRNSLFPVRDPRLIESLRIQN